MKTKKVYVVIDDTDSIFAIDDKPSVFFTKQQALENASYGEVIRIAKISYEV